MSKRRVVITGLGAVTAVGDGAEALWQAACQGRSGIAPTDLLGKAPEDWRPIAGFCKDFVPEKYVTQRKALKVMARDIQLAVAGASLAFADSGIDLSLEDRTRCGLIAGSGVLNHELDELAPSVYECMDDKGQPDLKKFGETGIPALFPLWLLKYLPNMPACHISILFDLEGVNNTLTTGASAGLQAVGEAYRILQRGSADLMLAGGAESKVNPMGLSRCALLGYLADLTSKDPQGIYRPFDRSATGLVIGEGAAFLVLEEREHALKRGAKIYAEIAGYGTSAEDGRALSMKVALEEARVAPKEISLVQGSGLGLKKEDEKEIDALNEIFQKEKTTLTSSKPVTGFAGFAAGALDLILAVKAMNTGLVAPLINFTEPVKPLAAEIVRKTALKKKLDCVMVNAFGLGAPATSLIIQTPSHGEVLDA